MNPEDELERRNVLQCLCAIGSCVSWRSGIHSTFPIGKAANASLASTKVTQRFAIDEPIGLENDSRCGFTLARIEDELFTLVYSQRPEAKKQLDLRYEISRLQRQLDDWWKEFGELFNKDMAGMAGEQSDENSSPGSSICRRRAICFHTIKILMAWPLAEGMSKEDRRNVLDNARCCLALFAQAWKAEADLGHFGVIARYVL